MSEKMIDRETFETLRSMTGPDFLQELIDVFLADSPTQIAEMRLALAEGNTERLRRAAHSLKSNALSFGANDLGDLAREVERMAKEGELAIAKVKIDELEAEYIQIVPVIAELNHG